MARTLVQVQADLALAYATRTSLLGKLATQVTINGRQVVMQSLKAIREEIRDLEAQEVSLGGTPGAGSGVAYASFSDPH
jgi:hypothetical protein